MAGPSSSEPAASTSSRPSRSWSRHLVHANGQYVPPVGEDGRTDPAAELGGAQGGRERLEHAEVIHRGGHDLDPEQQLQSAIESTLEGIPGRRIHLEKHVGQVKRAAKLLPGLRRLVTRDQSVDVLGTGAELPQVLFPCGAR